MSKRKTKQAADKSDRVKLSPATIHPDVARALREIQGERKCPMGMAIDELYWRLDRALQEIGTLNQQLTEIRRSPVINA